MSTARYTARHAAQRGAARNPESAMRERPADAAWHSPDGRSRGRRREASDAKHARRSVGREILEWAVTLALAVGLAFSVNTWVGGLITVKGQSMEPTLLDDERVLIGKIEYRFSGPKRGDIVIVKYPNRTDNIIKRVIATAGEKIAVSGGSVYIDGKKLDEPYIFEPIIGDFPETVVPEGAIFVMGDNRNDSMDSRSPSVGPVPLNQVIGKTYSIVWPPEDIKKLTNYAGVLENH